MEQNTTPETYDFFGKTESAEAILGRTRLRIRREAEALGWHLANREQDGKLPSLFEEWKAYHPGGRTRTYVAITYTLQGAVNMASTPRTYIHGKGKAERVLEILRAQAPRERAA